MDQQQQQQPVSMEQAIAKRACDFLKATELKGEEVQDYTAVWNLMNAVIAGDIRLVDAKHLEDLYESDDEIALMQECLNRWPGTVGKRVDQVRAERRAAQEKAQAPQPVQQAQMQNAPPTPPQG